MTAPAAVSRFAFPRERVKFPFPAQNARKNSSAKHKKHLFCHSLVKEVFFMALTKQFPLDKIKEKRKGMIA